MRAAIRAVTGMARISPIEPTGVRTISSAVYPLVSICAKAGVQANLLDLGRPAGRG
jgi:hypothetical protein